MTVRPVVSRMAQDEPAFGRERRELLARLGGRGCQVDVGVGERWRAAAGGGEEVLHEAGHPGGGPVHAAGRGPALLLVGLLGGEYGVQVGADDRERAAQLVRGVVDELALGAEGLVEPVEHRVHRVGEVAEFVLRAVQADALRQVGGLDLGRRTGDGADGAQGTPGEHPADREAGDGEAAEHDEGETAEVGECLVVDGRLDLLDLHRLDLPDVYVVDVLRGRELFGDGVRLAAALDREIRPAEDERGEHEQQAGVEDRETEADGVGEGGQPEREFHSRRAKPAERDSHGVSLSR